MKKYLLPFTHFLLFIFVFSFTVSCTNSLGKKEAWNLAYKQEFVSNCKAEINKEKTLVKIDSLIILKICDCVATKAEKEFAPLEMEEENSQTIMKTISTDCARDILIQK